MTFQLSHCPEHFFLVHLSLIKKVPHLLRTICAFLQELAVGDHKGAQLSGKTCNPEQDRIEKSIRQNCRQCGQKSRMLPNPVSSPRLPCSERVIDRLGIDFGCPSW